MTREEFEADKWQRISQDSIYDFEADIAGESQFDGGVESYGGALEIEKGKPSVFKRVGSFLYDQCHKLRTGHLSLETATPNHIQSLVPMDQNSKFENHNNQHLTVKETVPTQPRSPVALFSLETKLKWAEDDSQFLDQAEKLTEKRKHEDENWDKILENACIAADEMHDDHLAINSKVLAARQSLAGNKDNIKFALYSLRKQIRNLAEYENIPDELKPHRINFNKFIRSAAVALVVLGSTSFFGEHVSKNHEPKSIADKALTDSDTAGFIDDSATRFIDTSFIDSYFQSKTTESAIILEKPVIETNVRTIVIQPNGDSIWNAIKRSNNHLTTPQIVQIKNRIVIENHLESPYVVYAGQTFKY